MSASGGISIEDSILRRTVCIEPVPVEICDDDLLQAFACHGDVVNVKIVPLEKKSTLMALVQFSMEDGAQSACRDPKLNIRGVVGRITPSRVTIDVIPPVDAVFGKPMTVGKHVMAINPSKHDTTTQREYIMKQVSSIAAKILVDISKRTDWVIPDGEIERLIATKSPSRRHSDTRRSRSRSRSTRRRRTRDEEEWERLNSR
jgi:hypothetical protein